MKKRPDAPPPLDLIVEAIKHGRAAGGHRCLARAVPAHAQGVLRAAKYHSDLATACLTQWSETDDGRTGGDQ